MKQVLISVDVNEPVTLNRAKEHLRVLHNDDDAYIRDLIRAARQRAETFTGRHFVEKTIDLIFYNYKSSVEIPFKDVKSVELNHCFYRNVARQWQLFPAGAIHTELIPTVIFRQKPADILTETGEDQLIKMRIVVGPSEQVNHDVKYAILLMIATMYENREDVVRGMTINSIPENSTNLLRPYRIFKF